jgi:uncharacterized membrane protein
VTDQGMASRRATRARVATLYDLGARAAFLLALAGVILMLVTGVDPQAGPSAPPAILDWLPSLLALQPEAFIWAGIGVTAVLPAVGVAAAAVGFARSGNRRPALMAVVVLVLLALTVIAARVSL